MRLTYKRLPEVPSDFSEDFIRVCSSEFESIAGCPASRYRLQPWKGRVVSVDSESGTIWRLLKGHGNLSIREGECWMGPATCSQLDVAQGSSVVVRAAKPQWLGRLNYYNNHLNDVVRFSFRIGVGGLFFAVVSIVLSLCGGLAQ